MNIEQFVRESLKQVMSAVSLAQRDVPSVYGSGGYLGRRNGSGQPAEAQSEISFDLAVTVVESGQKSSGLDMEIRVCGYEVAKGSAGANRSEGDSRSTTSRIAFSVPCVWPSHVSPKDLAQGTPE